MHARMSAHTSAVAAVELCSTGSKSAQDKYMNSVKSFFMLLSQKENKYKIQMCEAAITANCIGIYMQVSWPDDQVIILCT